LGFLDEALRKADKAIMGWSRAGTRAAPDEEVADEAGSPASTFGINHILLKTLII
jgi:hypothetical protein